MSVKHCSHNDHKATNNTQGKRERQRKVNKQRLNLEGNSETVGGARVLAGAGPEVTRCCCSLSLDEFATT